MTTVSADILKQLTVGVPDYQRKQARKNGSRVERRRKRELDAVDWRNKPFTFDGVVEFSHRPEALDWAARQIALRLTALTGPRIEGLLPEAASRVLSGWTWVHTLRYPHGSVCALSGRPAKSFSIIVKPIDAWAEARYNDCQIVQVHHEVRRWIFGLTEKYVSAAIPADFADKLLGHINDPYGLAVRYNPKAGIYVEVDHHFPLNRGEFPVRRSK